jgi:hypothetical protein
LKCRNITEKVIGSTESPTDTGSLSTVLKVVTVVLVIINGASRKAERGDIYALSG